MTTERNAGTRRWEPPLDPRSWGGALVWMAALVLAVWVVQIVDAGHHYSLNRFGLRPRRADGLWGVLTEPFLHQSYGHTLSDTVPLLGVGWVLLLSGVRIWAIVTGVVLVLGGAAAWLVSPLPHHHSAIVGSSALVFGWMGYLLARAWFSRKLRWILVAVGVLFFFGTLLGSLLPSYDAAVPWAANLCGFLAGAVAGATLHPRRSSRRTGPRGTAVVS